MAVQKRRILLADDEPRIRDSVRMNLEIEGFDVFEAASGSEALEKVRLAMPDLVVLDVMMPELDGFETLRELRRFSTVPVIMLTVKADERDVARGLELGADDYVAKPFSQIVLTGAHQGRAAPRRAATTVTTPVDRRRRPPEHRLRAPRGDRRRPEGAASADRVPPALPPRQQPRLGPLARDAAVAGLGAEYRDASHYLRLYINYLRQKIEVDPVQPEVHPDRARRGYRFVDYARDS